MDEYGTSTHRPVFMTVTACLLACGLASSARSAEDGLAAGVLAVAALAIQHLLL